MYSIYLRACDTFSTFLLICIPRGVDKSLVFLFPIFLFAAQPKEFLLDGLKKLEQRSHKCVELREEYVE
jgi:hypothetical protein